MLDIGAIRPSSIPYSFNVVIVRKKECTLRFCIDNKKLDNRTQKDAHSSPRIDDTIHLLSGSRYFTKLDLKSGYWQMEMLEKQRKAAFQVGS